MFLWCVDEERSLWSYHQRKTMTGKDISNNVSTALDKLGVDWKRATNVVDGKAGRICGKTQEQSADVAYKLCIFQWILHQDALHAKTLGMDHVVKAVIKHSKSQSFQPSAVQLALRRW